MIATYDHQRRYSSVAIGLHWTIAAFVIVNLVLGLLHDSLLDGLAWVLPLHKSIGITVLALTLVRIGWRIGNPPPRLPMGLPLWERAAAHGVHFLLYFYMLALPVTGWMLVSGGRKSPIAWFGLFDVPFLPIAKPTANWAHNAHGVLGWIMLALVALHVLAALRHHLILRDTVLTRMIPGLNRR
jgi:cytochrome b561